MSAVTGDGDADDAAAAAAADAADAADDDDGVCSSIFPTFCTVLHKSATSSLLNDVNRGQGRFGITSTCPGNTGFIFTKAKDLGVSKKVCDG